MRTQRDILTISGDAWLDEAMTGNCRVIGVAGVRAGASVVCDAIEARDGVVVSGRLTGDVRSNGPIVIEPGGVLEGRAWAPALTVLPGGTCNARFATPARDTPPKPECAPKATQAADQAALSSVSVPVSMPTSMPTSMPMEAGIDPLTLRVAAPCP